MRFAILGTGGVGAYYGARLCDAGHAVLFIARGEQLAALQRDGLHVRHPEFEFQRRVEAASLDVLCSEHQSNQFDLLILCVKATATAAVAMQLAPWLGHAQLPVLSLQNGVDNERELARVLTADRVLGGYAVRVSAHVAAPGCVEAYGAGEAVLGEWPCAGSGSLAAAAIPAVARAFEASGIPTSVVDDILRELWRKLIINNGVNPLSTLTGRNTEDLTRDPILARIVKGAMRETALAAAADGVRLDDHDIEEMFQLISGFGAIKTSMQVDREHGRAIELAAIPGAVLARAHTLGIDVPYTLTLYALLENMQDIPAS